MKLKSVLVNIRNILPLKKEPIKVYLYCYDNKSFKNYISNKYPEIIGINSSNMIL